MDLSEDDALALALAMAIADDDSESDDFQHTARTQHQHNILRRCSANRPPERPQKKQKHTKKRKCNQNDPASVSASTNMKTKGRLNDSPGMKLNPVFKDSRKPLTDIDANKLVEDEKAKRIHQQFVSYGSEDVVTREAITNLRQPLDYSYSNEAAEIQNRSDETYQVQLLADEWSSMMTQDSISDRLMQVQNAGIHETKLFSLDGEYPICRVDQIISMEKNSYHWLKKTEEIISLAEEDEQETLGKGLQAIKNTELQIGEGFEEEVKLKQGAELKYITSRELQLNKVAINQDKATQNIEQVYAQKRGFEIDNGAISPIIINPESQLHTLLQLCAETPSDGQQIDSGEECLGLQFMEREDFAKVEDAIEVEEAMASVLTQSECSSFANLEFASEMDCLKVLSIGKPHINADNICEAIEKSSFKVEIHKHKATDVPLEFVVDDVSEQSEPFVKCPICQNCITKMSFEQRELHTNACLDNCNDGCINTNIMFCYDKVEAQEKNETGECVQLESSSDLAPVLRWLDTLNLSRYANIFIREEVDWDTFKCLSDEDLCTLGVTAFGPRSKILQSLKQLEQGSVISTSTGTNMQQDATNEQLAVNASGRKLITDFFILPPNQNKEISKPPVQESSCSDKARASSSIPARKRTVSTHVGSIPEWMCIPGINFRVDAFQHLRGDCAHWFLTHFHTDHYQGLTRTFRYGHVYTSTITAQIVNSRIGIPWERLKPLPLNEAVDIDGVKVTLLDANHCPGSVMFLFEPQNGKAVLHTGDFRFCEEMARNIVLQNSRIHTLMLDTTYCNPQYDFPNQETVIQFIIDAIQAEAFNPSTLFLIGTYTIGKERIFFEVAKALQKKIYVNVTKLRLLQCMKFSDEDLKWLTTNENDAHIHVVPLWSIASFKRMKHLARHHHGRYTSIVSFSPTGWSFGRGKKRTPGKRWQQGTIIRYEAPYSEHCSFNELREFVRFISPVNIVPSVHNDSAEAADALVALLLNEEAE